MKSTLPYCQSAPYNWPIGVESAWPAVRLPTTPAIAIPSGGWRYHARRIAASLGVKRAVYPFSDSVPEGHKDRNGEWPVGHEARTTEF